jgi:catechol 2,3-dioxygenase-like lactoylglutathione lyase family enzyme
MSGRRELAPLVDRLRPSGGRSKWARTLTGLRAKHPSPGPSRPPRDPHRTDQRRDNPAVIETDDSVVSVRYVVDDVQAAIDFYTTYLGFTLLSAHLPAFADVTRGRLRLLSGPGSSGARATPADASAAGRNRIHLTVDDLDAEIERLRSAGLTFRSNVVAGPGGRQILLADPADNLIELFTAGAPS